MSECVEGCKAWGRPRLMYHDIIEQVLSAGNVKSLYLHEKSYIFGGSKASVSGS